MLEIRHDSMNESRNIQQAYDDIYATEGIMHNDSLYLWLIGLLHPSTGHTLIDISCGQGRLIALAQQQGLNAIGIDFSIFGVRKGNEDSPSSGWVVGDGEYLPLEDMCADYVTHIGSLEHYYRPEYGAREITRILKPSGKACILLPNAFGLLGNILHVCSTGDIFDDGQPLQRYGTRRYWGNLLIEGGLQVERTLGYGEVTFPRTFQDTVNWFKNPRNIVRFALTPIIPLNLTNHLVYICTRA